jgi:transketolase
MPTEQELKLKSVRYRRKLLTCIMQARGGHTSGDLSCVDILNVLYNHVLNISPETFTDPDRDRYIQSKGHSVEALYVVLADRGFFPEEELETLGQYKSHFVGHPTRKVPGIEQNTGALGHGLSVCVGLALAGKMDGRTYKVYTLLGDGELAEGSSWEAMLATAHYKLDNIVAIIDRNFLQITGKTEDILALEPLEAKLKAFGWSVRTADGHDVGDLMDVLTDVPFEAGKPSAIIARTVKGKGVSFMENELLWHYRCPDADEARRALAELGETL